MAYHTGGSQWGKLYFLKEHLIVSIQYISGRGSAYGVGTERCTCNPKVRGSIPSAGNLRKNFNQMKIHGLPQNHYKGSQEQQYRGAWPDFLVWSCAVIQNIFGRSVNPIPTSGQILSTLYYWYPQIFSLSSINEIHAIATYHTSYILILQICFK